jgi:lipoprotein-anchoring transpeptidase ErfK/SrfK
VSRRTRAGDDLDSVTVRRAFLAALFVLGFLAAGGFSAAVVAGAVATSTTGAAATATVPTATVTVPSTPPPRTTPAPATIAPRVRVGPVRVGYLTAAQASKKVAAAFERPLPVVVGKARIAARPARLGARAYVKTAVSRASAASPGTQVPLTVTVAGNVLRRWARIVAKRYDRKPVDATLSLRGLRPWITPEQWGQELDMRSALPRIVRALRLGSRAPVRLKLTAIAPAVTRDSFGATIVIHRSFNRLSLYDGMRPWRTFGVATGQPSYPTPLGAYTIAVKWRDPWWYPPSSPWAQGAKPIPPGPGNPLGTRWMGLTAPGVGIHGTPDPASIGYSASHGCIRMRIPEAEWLFDHVAIGTPVFIVSG